MNVLEKFWYTKTEEQKELFSRLQTVSGNTRPWQGVKVASAWVAE